MRLFCDCKTDEEKSNFFLSGMAVETGIIAPAISNDVAMAYHRCAQFKKENDAMRAKIEAMEKQEPVGTLHDDGYFVWSVPSPYESNYAGLKTKLYALPGAQAHPAPGVRPAALHPVISWLRNGCDPMKAADELEILAAAPETKP